MSIERVTRSAVPHRERALPQEKCYPTGSLPHLRCYRRAGV
jgi:hypothetical protein